MGEGYKTNYEAGVGHFVDGGLLNKTGGSLNRLDGNVTGGDSTTQDVSNTSVAKISSPPPDKTIGYVSFTKADLSDPDVINECPVDPMTDEVSAQCFSLDLWSVDFVWYDGEAKTWKLYELESEEEMVLDARPTANVDPEKGWGQVPYWQTGERVLAIFNSQAGTFTPLNYGPEQLAMVEYSAVGHDEKEIEKEVDETDIGDRTAIAYLTVNDRSVVGRRGAYMLPSGSSKGKNFHTIHGSTCFPVKHGDKVKLNFGVSTDYGADVKAVNWGFRVKPLGRKWHPRGTSDNSSYEDPVGGCVVLGNIELTGESLNRYKDCPYSEANEAAPATGTEDAVEAGESVVFRFFNEDDPMTDFNWTCECDFWIELEITNTPHSGMVLVECGTGGIPSGNTVQCTVIDAPDGSPLSVNDSVKVHNQTADTRFATATHKGMVVFWKTVDNDAVYYVVNADEECE